jgi:hypothetical protein
MMRSLELQWRRHLTARQSPFALLAIFKNSVLMSQEARCISIVRINRLIWESIRCQLPEDSNLCDLKEMSFLLNDLHQNVNWNMLITSPVPLCVITRDALQFAIHITDLRKLLLLEGVIIGGVSISHQIYWTLKNILTTSNSNAIIKSHTLQLTTACTKSSQSAVSSPVVW